MLVRTRLWIDEHKQICTAGERTRKCVSPLANTQAHNHAHMHARMYAREHVRVHAHAHAHSHVHVHGRAQAP
eukprot:9678623-Alexandrium_andersonii.AAC.1